MFHIKEFPPARLWTWRSIDKLLLVVLLVNQIEDWCMSVPSFLKTALFIVFISHCTLAFICGCVICWVSSCKRFAWEFLPILRWNRDYMTVRSSKVKEPLDLSTWTTVMLRSSQQTDDYSCGVFVMMVCISVGEVIFRSVNCLKHLMIQNVLS